MQTTRFLADAVRGDAAALQALAARLWPLLAAMARHRLPAALRGVYAEEDLIQDVWVIALQRLGSLRPQEGRRTPVLVRFLRSVLELRLRSVLRREIRRTLGRGEAELDDLAASSRGVISDACCRERAEGVLAWISGLEEPKRTIVYLRGIEQRPAHEVARRLGMQPEAVAKAYYRELVRARELWPDSVLAELG